VTFSKRNAGESRGGWGGWQDRGGPRPRERARGPIVHRGSPRTCSSIPRTSPGSGRRASASL